MTDLERGLYEALLSEALAAALARLEHRGQDRLAPELVELNPVDAPDRIGLHLSRVIERALNDIIPRDRVKLGTRLVREIVDRAVQLDDAASLRAEQPAGTDSLRSLRSLRRLLPDGSPETIAAPMLPLLDTALLTNAPGEPRVGSQILTEIGSADRIDIIMAFIRRSGITPLLEALRRHCEAGRPLRVLTTIYTGSTEARALDALRAIGAEIRVSYDTSGTRLHAKAWLFHRRSGYSTAYIGSSNLTHTAQVDGLEWNVRVAGARNPPVVDKMAAVFESYWNDGDFEPYDAARFAREIGPPDAQGHGVVLPPTELRPEPFQERMLEQIALARLAGHHRNLLVSATGTGKTVMAALDYAGLRDAARREGVRCRLLFVAHRQELLNQARLTFCHALRDMNFGELWVGGARPLHFEHVFASVQSLSAAGVANIPSDQFDVVIVDEFHHAEAKTYTRLLAHLAPRELLGLTATPERADDASILHWFDGRIAAELRLWDAIDQRRLVPFAYYGVHDGVDLTHVPWRRGQGYVAEALSNVLTAHDAIARLVLKELLDRVDNHRTMRALGFCVSVQHAEFMARCFAQAGVAAVAVVGTTPDAQREQALKDLAEGHVNVLFSVDLFNEGIDVPTVDVLLLLRPTQSSTLFLQQLGRGLRRSPGKTICTVLDFVSLHHQEFRYDARYRVLLRTGSRRAIERQIEQGFPYLPAGCHMSLDPMASAVVLNSLRKALPNRWSAKVAELRAFAEGRERVTLADFLEDSGLELDDVYAGDRSWSDLCADAGLTVCQEGPQERLLRRACGRLRHVDDARRLLTWGAWISQADAPDIESMDAADVRLLRMLLVAMLGRTIDATMTIATAAARLWLHPQIRAELADLFALQLQRLSHLPATLVRHLHVPLTIHARYTRLEILAAFGVGDGVRLPPWQSGVYWATDERADLLTITFDKSADSFSPNTRYRDYAISRELIHWESQSTTREGGTTGQRYQHHVAMGTSVMLFARASTDERAFYFLGPATYVRHEGELPMAVTWRLHHPLPGDLFTEFAAAVA